MFRKLRIKFIAITMVMVAIVMAFAFTVVCAVEYQRSYSVVQTALDDAVQSAIRDHGMRPLRNPASATEEGGVPAGRPQDGDAGGGQQVGETQSAETAEGAQGTAAADGEQGPATDGGDQEATPPAIGRRGGEQRASSSLIPVAVYRVAGDGASTAVPQVTSASISKDLLHEALEAVKDREDGYGTLADLGLHYRKAPFDDGSFVVFTDTSYTDGWKSLALVLAGTGVGTLVVFLVVALFYSRWALRPVREAWDSQRQFIADASHDLKTPLTVILANAAILLKHPDHTIASESQWVESTQKEAEVMQGLVNEMLELAQIEAGQQIELAREPIDLSDLVDGETLMFDSVALERGCGFNCAIDQGITILGDEKRIGKLVSTLVENAFKYVDEEGAIDIDLHKAGKMAVIDIHNTGSTISEEDLPHIFDRFYRTDKARTSGTGGFGLGLAIAREIARRHDGDVTCKSSPEDGTTFTITLPLA